MRSPGRRKAGARRGEDGFTLIELLVVIIILGILSAVVVFAIRGQTQKGKASAYATDADTIRTAQEAFCAKFGHYATMDELVNPPQGGGGFLSEPSTLHQVHTGTGGACKGAGRLDRSGFSITCDVTGPLGCGAGGALALGGTLVINNGSGVPASALNPAISSEGGLHSNSEDMFNGLLRYEPDGSIGGDLAQSFNFNNAVPSSANPNCAAAACDATTTVATFVLRENVKFHGASASSPGDGLTLTPGDVEFSFSKAILAAHGRTRAIIGTLGVTGSQLSTVVPPDAIQTLPPTPGNGGTVIFNLRQVFAPLRFTLNVTEAPIISEAAYGPCWDNGTLFTAGNACPSNVSPVGTGPFRFESLNSTGITTVKNPDYFRTDSFGVRLPYFDKVFKKVVTASGKDSLKSGEVDVASIAANDRPALVSDPTVTLSATPRGSGGGNCITTFAFNTTKRAAGNSTVAPPPPGGAAAIGQPEANGGYPADSPYFGQNKPNSNENARPHQILGDSRVREAIFKALDRNALWNTAAFGAGRVADAPVHSIFQPNGAYQGPQPLPTFDRAAANALLDAAGWSVIGGDGFRRALDHPNENHPDPQLAVPDGTVLALEFLASSNQFTVPVESQLATVGIDITQVIGNNTTFVAPRLFHARTFDIGVISYCNNDEPQFGVRRQYHTDALIQTNAFTNASGYKSVVMDQLWLEASKAPDVATYQSKFLQIQRLALGLSTPGGVTVAPGSVEDLQKIPMVQVLESAGTRGTLRSCTGFNNNNTGLYMEAASCQR